MAMSDPPAEMERTTAVVLLGIALVAGVVLRFPSLGVQSLWLDEGATWLQVRGSFVDMIRLTAADNYPPLYNVFAWALVHLFGDSDFALRLPSAIAGTATIGVFYALVARLGGRLAGVIAAFALAGSGFHIWYSQEARPYALMTLCAVAFVLAAMIFLTSPKRQSPWWLILSGAALLYTHPFGALTWISIVAAAGWIALRVRPDSPRLRQFAMIQAVIALTFVPWGAILVLRAQAVHAHGFWIPVPTVHYVLGVLWELQTGSYGALFALAGLICLVVALTRRDAAPGAIGSSAGLPTVSIFLLIWTLGPLLLALVASIYQPMVLARYLIATLPGWIALASIGFALCAGSNSRWILVVLIFTLATAGLAMRFQSPGPRPDWRGADRYIESTKTSSDCILVRPLHDEPFVRRYLSTPPACLIATDGPLDLSQVASTVHRLFVFAGTDDIRAALASQAGSSWTPSTVGLGNMSVTVLSR